MDWFPYDNGLGHERVNEEFHRNICGKMESEIKIFSLAFTSVVLSPKHVESEESTGKV